MSFATDFVKMAYKKVSVLNMSEIIAVLSGEVKETLYNDLCIDSCTNCITLYND